jgi:predicted nucleic acid-binding protein
MAYLIDTNIIIYSLKNDKKVQEKFLEAEASWQIQAQKVPVELSNPK